MVIRATSVFATLVACCALVACKPDFGARASQVDGLRILAVRSVPAEASPDTPIHYEALVAQPGGSVQNAQIDWAFCTASKPVNELNDVNLSCFNRTADWIVPLTVGPSADGKIPTVACRQFGSDTPASKPGDPPGRPTDPDTTGGYYQPVRLLLASSDPVGVLALGQTRVRCNLVGATPDVSTAFGQGYRANENPVFFPDQVTLTPAGTAVTEESSSAAATEVTAGSQVVLQVGWPACPDPPVCGDGICSPHEDTTNCPADCAKPKGCGGSEHYAYFDPVSLTLVDRREAIRVAWFSDQGSWHDDATGRSESDYASSTAGIDNTSNTWTAPATGGTTAHIWVVMSDSRGGLAWKSLKVAVK